MNSLIALVAATCVASSLGSASNEVHMFASSATMQAMEKVFLRSEEAHQSSMAAITKSLSTPEDALNVLHKKNMASPALMQVAEEAFGKHSHLRRAPTKGYSGIEGAKHLLNDMIFEASSKYDAEIAKCSEFYSSQCSLLTTARGEISASNYVAANSRMKILNSQGTINMCEQDIPSRKLQLESHNRKCRHELRKLNQRLKIILGDISVMTMILKMTDCEKKLLLQEEIGLMRCEDGCTKKPFISFKHHELRRQISQLQSESSKQLTSDVMEDLFDGVDNLQQVSFHAIPIINKTNFVNPPLPRTAAPENPCNDPNQGAPSAGTKRSAKCTINKSPHCYKLQERFLLVQSGIQDDRDDIMQEISKLESSCEETKQTLETQIANDETMLSDAQTKLASATEDEANAGEKARQTSKEFNSMNNDLVQQMKTCNTNYINFETELCALKKIRGELYKMKGGGGASSAFFVDCAVTKWDMEECTRKCGGGSQKLVRGVITHPNGGAKCLPLAAVKSCNLNPCPLDCRLQEWSGWSKCSAQCGGGVMQRLRDVTRPMKFGGKPCGETSETKSCNAQACEKDCSLGSWTRWSGCSKDCDGGTSKRQRFVKTEAVGEGKCPNQWSKQRLQYRSCNMRRCRVKPGRVLKCRATLDVVLLLDGSGSLGRRGWDAEIQAAYKFVSAFTGNAKIAVVVFSGPKTFSGVKQCMGNTKKSIDVSQCGIQTVTHFTSNLKKVKKLILGLEFPQGSTLTALALANAKAELNLGRKSAKSVVVVFTDGRPLSYRKTMLAARELRESARLMWVPITKRAPLKFIKKAATRRWQENLVLAKDYKALKDPATITHLIADMCPKPRPKL